MGQKTHPIGFRLGVIKDWNSKWFAKKNYMNLLHEDLKIKSFIRRHLSHAGISNIRVIRFGKKVEIDIMTARPGIIIGKGGQEVENLKKVLQKLINNNQISININEIKVPEIDARLVAESIARKLEKRIAYRRAIKQAISLAMRQGAQGIKIAVSGRLAGSEIARREWSREGRVPLHTIRADIDYGTDEALTTYGRIGIKVWIFKGEIFKDKIEESTAGIKGTLHKGLEEV